MARHIPFQTPNIPPRTFFNKVPEERYTKNISKRSFCLEKGFIFKDEPFMRYDESVTSIIEKHDWQIFCVQSDDFLTKVVREFYAHLMSPNKICLCEGCFGAIWWVLHQRTILFFLCLRRTHSFLQPSLLMAWRRSLKTCVLRELSG